MDSGTRFLVTERFYVDRRSETLVVDGAAVPINHRTYQVMLLLMSRPDELVEKRELFENIWGTLDVSDAVLTTAIKELRQALGDDARAPWAIATVHARGYRFLLPVRQSNTIEMPPEPDDIHSGPGRNSKIAWIAVAALAVIAMMFALLAGPPFSSQQAAPDGQQSIAVLPFDDLSEAGDQKWFADGLAEEILNSLAQSKDLLIAARTSSFRFSTGGNDIREIGRDLNVTHVLEGSVRRGADQLRVTAQLIRAQDGFHVWSKTYDIPADTNNALSLQRNIAEDVLSLLNAGFAEPVVPDEQISIPLDSYERYLRGRQMVMTRRSEAVLEGLEELDSLVQLAPDFAPGHAWLAYAYLLSTQFSGRPVFESTTAADTHVRRALELDPDGADSLTAAALLELARRDVDSALDYANRAVAANPNHVPALRRRGVILLNTGQVRQAHEDFLAVRARDPLSAITLSHVADTFAILNDKEQSLSAAREGVRWNPDSAIANGTLGRLLANVGEYSNALSHLEKAVEINPRAALGTLALASLYWQVGMDDHLDFAEPALAWNGLAAAAMSSGNVEKSIELAETYGIGSTGALAAMHIYHWNRDTESAYTPAMRLVSQSGIADRGLDFGYRPGAVPAMLALEANGDPQAQAIRDNLSTLFAGKKPGSYTFGTDLYGAASWQMVNGHVSEAQAWLDDALERGFVFRALHLDPVWDPIRESSRFQAILATTDQLAESAREKYCELQQHC